MLERPSTVRLLACAAFFVAMAAIAPSVRAEQTGEAEAAALYRVASAPASTKTERELAQYRLAIALYHLKLYQGAYGLFSEIADDPKHAKYRETLPWLAKLAVVLPEPADIVERVGKYDEAQIARLDGTVRHELYWQLAYLLGRYKYRNRQYDEAVALFANVGRGSEYYVEARFMIGITKIQLLRPYDAVRVFSQTLDAIDTGEVQLRDGGRMHDLLLLSLARATYGIATRTQSQGEHRSARVYFETAAKGWSGLSASSEYWADALFEQSWAFFMLGDLPRALGNLHVVTSGQPHEPYRPEAAVLRTSIYLAHCRYEDAASLAARFHQRYQPIARELATVLRSHRDGDVEPASYRLLLDLRDGKTNVSAPTKLAAADALGDRRLLRHVAYLRYIDSETKRFGMTTTAFHESPLGSAIEDGLTLARDIAVRNAGQLVQERLQRSLDELEVHLAHNARLLAAAMEGRRGAALPDLAPWRITARDVVPQDGDVVLWPFTGELWADEGSYRQSLRSACK